MAFTDSNDQNYLHSSYAGRLPMRWIFADRGQSSEGRAITAIDDHVSEWWQAFAGKTGDIVAHFNRKKDWDLPGWMQEQLGAIDDAICWEFGPAVKGQGHRLVITPESRKDLRPLANSIVASAPRIAGWEFYPYRLAEGLDEAFLTVEGRTGKPCPEVEVVVEKKSSHLVTLQFRSPQFAGPDDADALNAAFILAETLLGEDVLDHWIGDLSVDRKKKGFLGLGKSKGVAVPLAQLRVTVQQEIQSIRSNLPEKPHFQWCNDTNWSLLKLNPKEADDYSERLDLLTYMTLNPELAGASFRQGFSSQRYSRHKEVFCYLKIDGAGGLDGSNYNDRSEIEDALNEFLIGPGSGCVVGGGTGLRYTYIDLAVLEFTKTTRAVCEFLRAGNLPHRSWLLFMDADYSGEWLGIYPDTPPPPDGDVDDDTEDE